MDRSNSTQIAAVNPVITAIPTVSPRDRTPTRPTRGHATMATANRTRSTESGLSSSSGASRANHDRVLGKSRLRGRAERPRRALVTVPSSAAPRPTQPRHVITGRWPDSMFLHR